MTRKLPLVFVSYARMDRGLAGPIVRILKSAQNEVFFDVENLEPGDEWETILLKYITGAALVFVFWSKRARRSKWVQSEWKAAIQHEKRVIPVLLDQTPLPGALAKHNRRPGSESTILPCAEPCFFGVSVAVYRIPPGTHDIAFHSTLIGPWPVWGGRFRGVRALIRG
jgi:TIR domain